jgi:23S rRNA (uracil1939-C5)-methyltransferase
VVPQDCLVETEANQRAWAVLRTKELPPEVLQVHFRSAGADIGICLFVKRLTVRAREFAMDLFQSIPGAVGIGAAGYHDYQLVAGVGAVEQSLGGIRYRIPLNGFFQTNHQQALVLRDLAVTWLEPGKTDRVLDLYCGAGFFSLALARLSERVVAIESNHESTRAGIENARLNGLANVRFVTSDVAHGLTALRRGDFGLALLDPPREGCDPEVLRSLIRVQPRRIAYVSCSPETLGRDLRVLADAGYRLEFCQPVDMFPHTAHIELVAGLVMAVD